MELSDNEIKKIVLEIKDLHFSNKDEAAYYILDKLVQELNLINLRSTLYTEQKLLIAFIHSTLSLDKFYLLAGDIYSNVGEYAKSLEAYKMYHFWIQQVKPHESLINKKSAIVYSFRSYNAYFMEDLINKTITCSPPSEMNDPFDSIVSYWSKSKNLDSICNKRNNNDSYSESFDYYRIRSFVANTDNYETDDKLLDNVKMWSHYADSHQGFCVKYRLSKSFIKSDKPYEKIEDEEFKYNILRLYPVIYKPDISLKEMKAVDATEIICRKSMVWSDESEIRLISYNPYNEKKWISLPLDDSTIEEIIFGYRCSERHKSTIYNIAKDLYPNLQFSKMYVDENKSLYNMLKKEYQPCVNV